MKIDPQLLKFPRTLPNDIESFTIFYPQKFPGIVSYYESIVKDIWHDPKAYRDYGDSMRDELWEGFKKIKDDYDAGDQTSLDFLVSIDQRLNKLICYRFWIVNYIFPDGPIHDFFIDTLRNTVRQIVDVGEDVDEYEHEVAQMQRDLLQTDYADFYLQQALEGAEIIELLPKNPELFSLYKKAEPLIDAHDEKYTPEIHAIWGEFLQLLDRQAPDHPIAKLLSTTRLLAKLRKSDVPTYSALTHAVEFRQENKHLVARHQIMTEKIVDHMRLAKASLNSEDYAMFVLAYEQCRNFTMYKDVMGIIDTVLLPLWFGLIGKVRELLLPNDLVAKKRPVGHCAMFYFLVWYLPDHLKGKVMTVDKTPFDLNTL